MTALTSRIAQHDATAAKGASRLAELSSSGDRLHAADQDQKAAAAARVLAQAFPPTDIHAPLTAWTPAEWHAVLTAQIARNTTVRQRARDQDIIRRYHAGDRITDIADSCGLTKDGVDSVLTRHGVLRTRKRGKR